MRLTTQACFMACLGHSLVPYTHGLNLASIPAPTPSNHSSQLDSVWSAISPLRSSMSRALQATTPRPTRYWTARPTAGPTMAPTKEPTMAPTNCAKGHYYFYYTRSCQICLFGKYLSTSTKCEFCPQGYYGDSKVTAHYDYIKSYIYIS